jgi:p-cumate 2,3-dioxygenase beta subunit
MSAAQITRAEVEDFLFAEAALLDAWRLDEWLALFAEGATYEVPTAGASDDVSSVNNLFYIADDYERLKHRVRRLNKKTAHAEWPRSDGARAINNVRILDRDIAKGEIRVGCVFITYRAKNDVTETFFGHHIYVLKVDGGQIRIASKRTMLDMTSLHPQGRVSIIV